MALRFLLGLAHIYILLGLTYLLGRFCFDLLVFTLTYLFSLLIYLPGLWLTYTGLVILQVIVWHALRDRFTK